jgi:hypothetical protein
MPKGIYKRTEEHRRKLSESQKGRINLYFSLDKIPYLRIIRSNGK